MVLFHFQFRFYRVWIIYFCLAFLMSVLLKRHRQKTITLPEWISFSRICGVRKNTRFSFHCAALLSGIVWPVKSIVHSCNQLSMCMFNKSTNNLFEGENIIIILEIIPMQNNWHITYLILLGVYQQHYDTLLFAARLKALKVQQKQFYLIKYRMNVNKRAKTYINSINVTA